MPSVESLARGCCLGDSGESDIELVSAVARANQAFRVAADTTKTRIEYTVFAYKSLA